jgi:hypothetical protein
MKTQTQLFTSKGNAHDNQQRDKANPSLVTGHANGKSVIKRDEVLSTYHFKAVPGFEHTPRPHRYTKCFA